MAYQDASNENNSDQNDTSAKLSSLSPIQLEQWCNRYLEADEFKDYCPNGLQVDADKPIHKIITGVTATQNLIDAAIAANADAIVVHHGYFWKGESQPITGIKGKRVRSLLQNNISLLAYHLPLDAHPTVGNNAILAQQLGLSITGPLYPEQRRPVGNVASCKPQPIEALINTVTDVLNRVPLHIEAYATNSPIYGSTIDPSRAIKTVGICTGGAQDMIDQAALMGCDAYISGEISERTTHLARELGIHYLACGHHATEIGGIQAFGDIIANHFGVSVQFIDDPNPT